MGEVYKAKDTRLDRSVAIKVLSSHLSGSSELRERFEREARAVSSLNHPNICTLHDIGREGKTDFLVMEHVEGESLADRLKKGALPFDEALTYSTEIADALEKAHRAGVVHRDLKPGNIMITKTGAKLLDFGLAKLAGSTTPTPELSTLSALPTEQRSLTAAGTILGDIPIHGSRAARGRRNRRANRHLCARCRHLRDGDRQEGVRGQEPSELDLGHHVGKPGTGLQCDTAFAGGAGTCHPAMFG